MRNFNFLHLFSGNSTNSTSAGKNKRKRGRVCRIEQLEERDLLSVTPFSMGYEDVCNTYADNLIYENAPVSPDSERIQAANAPVALNAAPGLKVATDLASGVLTVLGTDGADWVEIQETASQVIVHTPL